VGLSVSGQQAWSTVQTEAGPITLAPMDSLRARITQLNEWLSQAESTSARLHSQADDGYASAGAVLVPRKNDWTVPVAIDGQISRATALVAQIAGSDQAAVELKEKQSHGNVFGRIGAWRQVGGLSKQRASEAAELRALLIQVAKAAPPTTIAEAEGGIRAASDIEQQAAKVDEQVTATKQSVAALNTELQRREESLKTMGFDALFEAASLATSGAAAAKFRHKSTCQTKPDQAMALRIVC